MAYISCNIPSKRIKVPKTYKTIEPLVIQATIGATDLIILGMYRPPKAKGDSQYFLKVEEELNSICTWVSMLKNFVMITGDLNLDRLRPEKKEGKILIDLEDVHNLECLIKDPTRITTTTQTLIDVMLTNKPQAFKSSGVFNPELSDHSMIYSIMNDKVKQYPNKVISYRNYADMDENKLKEDLDTAPWHVMEIFDSLEDKCNYWSGLLHQVIDDHAPVKRKRVRAKDVPYMNKEWKAAIREKRRAAQNFAKDKTPEKFELKRKMRNEATRQRRIAIKGYWEKTTKHMQSKPKDFYKVFQPFLDNRNKSNRDNTININCNGTIEQDQHVVAEVMAEYFSTIADHIGKQANHSTEKEFSNHPSVTEINKEWNNKDTFEFRCVNKTETEKLYLTS